MPPAARSIRMVWPALRFNTGIAGEVLLATLTFQGLAEGQTLLTPGCGPEEDEGLMLESTVMVHRDPVHRRNADGDSRTCDSPADRGTTRADASPLTDLSTAPAITTQRASLGGTPLGDARLCYREVGCSGSSKTMTAVDGKTGYSMRQR